MHAQSQASGEFGLIGYLEHIEQQCLTGSGRVGYATHLLDSHKPKSGLRSELVTEECIQRGKVQHRRHYLKLGIDPNLQYIHKPSGFRIKICLKIRPDQPGAESPEAMTELQLSAFLRGAFAQGPGHKQKMTHWISSQKAQQEGAIRMEDRHSTKTGSQGRTVEGLDQVE
jgi:hypothetical protein